MKKRALVICPGRGSYTKQNLGYLSKPKNLFHDFLQDIDQRRELIGEPTISDLDGRKSFITSLHTKGEHASPLIYACAYKDFLTINQDEYEIVGICGNSMGWYLSLAMGEALDWAGSFHLIQTMGSMMRESLIGAQIIYPVINEDWSFSSQKADELERLMAEANNKSGGKSYTSIYLGGYRVVAGDVTAIQHLLKHLPKVGDYPFQLLNHGAFHTPLLNVVSQKAFQDISIDLFHKPRFPLVDGRGVIFDPYNASIEDLYDYTLGSQVVSTYDFSKSLSVALKELAPEKIFLLGPGNSLGGVVGQVLIAEKWKGLESKEDFQTLQKENPLLISMGL